jgi:hypothetical protein
MRKSVVDVMSKALEPKMSHYDIYVYKGWTLREVQDKMVTPHWNPSKQAWEDIAILKTTIVWGTHQKCGIAGFIQITTGKAFCHKCGEKMEPETFENLRDAMELMKSSLEDSEPGNTSDF